MAGFGSEVLVGFYDGVGGWGLGGGLGAPSDYSPDSPTSNSVLVSTKKRLKCAPPELPLKMLHFQTFLLRFTAPIPSRKAPFLNSLNGTNVSFEVSKV